MEYNHKERNLVSLVFVVYLDCIVMRLLLLCYLTVLMEAYCGKNHNRSVETKHFGNVNHLLNA